MGKRPQGDFSAGRVVIHDNAEIYATCGHGTLTPKAIHLHGRTLPIQRTVRRWTGRICGTPLLYYEVETAADQRLKLCYHTAGVLWMAEEMAAAAK